MRALSKCSLLCKYRGWIKFIDPLEYSSFCWCDKFSWKSFRLSMIRGWSIIKERQSEIHYTLSIQLQTQSFRGYAISKHHRKQYYKPKFVTKMFPTSVAKRYNVAGRAEYQLVVPQRECVHLNQCVHHIIVTVVTAREKCVDANSQDLRRDVTKYLCIFNYIFSFLGVSRGWYSMWFILVWVKNDKIRNL
jgi:hypothetical protein